MVNTKAVTVVAALALFAGRGRAADTPLPQAVTHLRWNAWDPLASASGDGTAGVSQIVNPPSPICSTVTSSAANVNTDCEGVAPHNETTIAVNPTNHANLIAGANDYQLRLSSGGVTYETVQSRAHVSFDGGDTWTTYPLPYGGYTGTGDPAVAFDADGTAYYATLGFTFGQRSPTGTNSDVVVTTSTDGGKTWSRLSRVASSSGSFGSVGVFNDKEEIAAWGHGNAIVTWTRFLQGPHGAYLGSPIYASVTHDGGETWSAGVEISGSAAFCVGFAGDTACNQDQGSVPAVAADGAIYVAFLSTADLTSGRDQYLVVKVDPDTGERVAGPYRVAGVFDGYTDYPINIDGRQTYQDSQFRTWALGNLTTDPTNASHLAVAWSDMRNSTLPAPADPYVAKTNSDVVVAQSFDGGATWSDVTSLASPGDQFMPWASYGPDGKLRIGYFDRSYDSANHKYGYTLATETTAGTLAFSTAQLTTVLSDPTQGTRWFSGRTPNPSFPHPTTFLGDYSGIDATTAGFVTALWTDLRNTVTFGVRTGTGQDATFGASP